jgi:hypothetical protein
MMNRTFRDLLNLVGKIIVHLLGKEYITRGFHTAENRLKGALVKVKVSTLQALEGTVCNYLLNYEPTLI